eukprot:5015192-Prorocentrum_lima.AAC.1
MTQAGSTSGNQAGTLYTSWPQNLRGSWHIWNGQQMIIYGEVEAATAEHAEQLHIQLNNQAID